MADEGTPLHHVSESLDILTVLLNRGADPTMLNNDGMSPLMYHVFWGRADVVKPLLEDPRVRATIDMQNRHGETALHFACSHHHDETKSHAMVRPLLEAGANPTLSNKSGQMPLAYLRRQHPAYHTTIALLEQALAATETTSLLVKAQCLAVAARSNIVAPSCLQVRVEGGQPLPCVTLTPVGNDEEGRKFRTMLYVLLGIGVGGPEGGGMPRDVFRVVLDLLMPTWDPLRKCGVVERLLDGGE